MDNDIAGPATESTPDDDGVAFVASLTRTIRTHITICGCGCYVWTGSLDTGQYAKAKMRGKTIVVHRYVWNQAHPDRLLAGYDDTIDHLCDRHRNCLNPDHMEVISRSENSVRANDRRWHHNDRDRASCTVT